MRVRSPDLFATIHAEGGVLPADLLGRIADGSPLIGLEPSTYGLVGSERFGEAITRSWNRLSGAWTAFSDARAKLLPTDRAGALTRDRWLAVLLEELRFGRVARQPPLQIDGREFPVHAVWQDRVPLHLVGAGVDLDRQAKGVVGAAKQSPHSLLQELLNRSAPHLWGIASNGLRLRLLRDNVSLTRQAYVEFDLEAMFTTEAYADFVVLWLTCHASRFEGDRAADCWLEQWSRLAAEEGVPALNRLRDGVQEAIELLGSGFLAHPANAALTDDLAHGVVSDEELRRYLLRLVYRLLFLFVAEDRGVLLVGDNLEARERYRRHYATRRLRDLAGRRRGGRHHDLYEQHKVVTSLLRERGCAPLALPALGSFLWSPEAVGPLSAAQLDNVTFSRPSSPWPTSSRKASGDRSTFATSAPRSSAPSTNRCSSCIRGSDRRAAAFALDVAAGSERKETGSYYTPSSLIGRCSTRPSNRSSTDARPQPTRPPRSSACASSTRHAAPATSSSPPPTASPSASPRCATDEPEPPPAEMRHAVRDVIAPLHLRRRRQPDGRRAVQGLPLARSARARPTARFLDHRIVLGNCLLGATPELIAAGDPDAAYKPLLGDDKTAVARIRQAQPSRSSAARHRALHRLAGTMTRPTVAAKAAAIASRRTRRSRTSTFRNERHRHLLASAPHVRQRWAADAWCAAFVAPRGEGASTAIPRTSSAGRPPLAPRRSAMTSATVITGARHRAPLLPLARHVP